MEDNKQGELKNEREKLLSVLNVLLARGKHKVSFLAKLIFAEALVDAYFPAPDEKQKKIIASIFKRFVQYNNRIVTNNKGLAIVGDNNKVTIIDGICRDKMQNGKS